MGCFELHPSCAAEDPGNENIIKIFHCKNISHSVGETQKDIESRQLFFKHLINHENAIFIQLEAILLFL